MVAKTIDVDFSPENMQKAFDNPILADNFILMFGGLHTDGKPITNDPTWAPEGWDARKRPWYNVAKENNKATLTAPYEDASTKELLISAVANVADKGTFKGAFGGDLSLKTISEAINSVNFNNTGHAFLISADGNIISHPDITLNGKSLADAFGQYPPQISADLQETEFDGKTVLTSFQPLTELKGSQWFIGVALQKDKVYKQATAFGLAAIVGTLISVLLSAIGLFLTMRSLFKPLEELQKSLIEINSGDGDLTKRLATSTKDEFGAVSNDFNQFVQYLQNIIIDVKRISIDISSNTSQSSSAAAKTADDLIVQLDELDMLSAAINQMSYSAQEVASNADKAAEAAKKADTAASKGSAIVTQTSQSIAQLVEEMDQTVITVNQLEKYSDDIESVLTSITSIAQQTNLLALNAAIEAARAGDMGRGFAVVADEVRALAARTQQSTNETSLIIEQLQNGVKEAADKIELSRSHANKTNEDSSRADDILKDIQCSISEISDTTIAIATAANQQSSTSEEINRNATTIRDICQNVSSQAQGQSELCATMVHFTEEQDKVLQKFKV
ncbi:MAG: hypothetical protein OFPII_05400 [Osedax symbiont Rs1]|nr:MAG: hypothetical protein OFPII_05400 [Osedax symbiont Rs1]